MNEERQKLVNEVRAYLDEIEQCPFKITSTVRGWLELRTEQIRVLLEALIVYQSPDAEKMEFRDELLNTFFHYKKS